MKAELRALIINAYDEIESLEPDISTERLLFMTAQTCRCDIGDVCEAIEPEATE